MITFINVDTSSYRACKKLQYSSTFRKALVKHVITKDHRVDWDHSKILTFETDFTKRRFLESFFIHNSENSINDKENSFYSEIYDNLT